MILHFLICISQGIPHTQMDLSALAEAIALFSKDPATPSIQLKCASIFRRQTSDSASNSFSPSPISAASDG
jgi:hypothetical protein